MNAEALIIKVKQYPILIAGIAISLVCLILIYARGSRADDFELKMQDKDREWSQMQGNVERSKDFGTHVETLESYEASIADRLMVYESVAINYEFFYELERRTGIRITTINQLPLPNEKNLPPQIAGVKQFSAIPYNIIVEGDYTNILRFIHLLERERYIIRLDAFNLSSNTRGQTGDQAPLTARLECFVLGKKDA